MSCYAFFKWWLLLSLHPYCLRIKTPFVTLSIYFGTLTLVSLVRVFERDLTPRPPFLINTVNRFRVGKNSVPVKVCEFYPCFTPSTSLLRLYFGTFQQEPAIARLDRLFTPNHKSSKCMYTTLVRTSISLSENFTLLMIRSSGFVSHSSD